MPRKDTIHCLYIDDDQEDLYEYVGLMEMSWDLLKLDINIIVESELGFDKARECIKGKEDQIDLLIVDVFRTIDAERRTEEGLHVIDWARKKYPDLPILALSVGGSGVETRVIDFGADEWVSKQYTSSDKEGKERLANKMLSALRKRGVVNLEDLGQPADWERKNLALSVVVEHIHPNVLSGLAEKLIGLPLLSVYAHYVAPGFSGSEVVYLDCKAGKSHDERKILLKASRDSERVQRELKKVEIAKTIWSPTQFVFYDSRRVEQLEGWYAISAPFESGAKTLSAWLASGDASNKAVNALMAEICLESGFKDRYRCRRTTRKNAMYTLLDLFPKHRKVRALSALAELGSLANSSQTGNTFNAQLLSSFITDSIIGGINQNDLVRKVADDSYLCGSHGDLHSRNLLVTARKSSVLIDPSEVEFMHWAADIARLTVDLILSCWDAGTESYVWNKKRMAVWERVVCAVLGEGSLPRGGAKNRAIRYALFWLRENWTDIYENLPSERMWEFYIALAIEFLRSTYRQDLPAPKRALGLIAASKALSVAERALR